MGPVVQAIPDVDALLSLELEELGPSVFIAKRDGGGMFSFIGFGGKQGILEMRGQG